MQRRAAMDLSPCRFDTLEVDGFAGLNIEARRQRAIPAGVRWFSREDVQSHRTATTI
jgi:hypothetical protein